MSVPAIVGAILSFAVLAGYAAEVHKHAEAIPKYGGLVKEAGEVDFELVAKPDRITLFLEDHGKAVDTKGIVAKITLRAGSKHSAVNLAPAGDNKLEAMGSFKIAAGTPAIVQVMQPGKAEQSMRFTLK